MSTVYEYLIQKAGGFSSEKESGLSSVPSLKTSTFGDIPIYKHPSDFLCTNQKSLEKVFNNIRSFRGFAYPLYAGFGNSIIPRIGEKLILPNKTETSYLPFFSIGGQVKNVQSADSGFVYLDVELMNSKNFTVAIYPERNNVSKDFGILYKVSTANYSQEDFEKKNWVKECYRNNYSFYKVEEVNFSEGFTDLFYTGTSERGNLKSKHLNESDIGSLKGALILAGPSPDSDYFFCDYSFESGPYTWASAWYTKDGVPVVDAILFTKETKVV